jgi:hypothetical protein
MAGLTPSASYRMLALALCALWLPAAQAQDRVAQLQAEFERESDPVRKAKLVPKLGDAQFAQARRALQADDYAQALQVLQQYRDEVRTAHAALKATGVNAEEKPNGFKQLQIHARKGVREMDQIVLDLPVEQRDAFQAVRRDVAAIEKELFDMLFPRQPGKGPLQKKRKG